MGEGLNFIAVLRGQYGLPLCRAVRGVLWVHQAYEMTAEDVEKKKNQNQTHLVDTDAKSSLFFCHIFLLHGKSWRAGFMLGGENR